MNEDDRSSPLPPIAVPHTQLSPDALTGVIESFVLREGTDYGGGEYSLAEKVEQVHAQLRKGKVRVTFDPEQDTVSLETANGRG